MPNGVKKENLPVKICVTCQRPFTWRKRWERCWDEVTTCSKSCNSKRRSAHQLRGILQRGSDLVFMEDSSDTACKEADEVIDNIEADFGTQFSLHERKFQLEELSDSDREGGDEPAQNQDLDPKAAKRTAKKALKVSRREKRMGSEESIKEKQKPCDLCTKNVNLLIRCQIDETKKWKMVCGKCWHEVSGGQVDGDSAHPHYRYGGLWKNRSAQQHK